MGKTWTLSVDATQGAVQAVMHDLGMGWIEVGRGEWYQTGVSMLSKTNATPQELLDLKAELEARGYATKF